MRVALTGVSGFLGSAFARGLCAAGHRVTGLVRPKSRRDHVEAFVDRFVTGEHDDPSCWPALLEGADCVIHSSLDWSSMRPDPPDRATQLRSNLAGSALLLHASAPRQFVYISSMAVYHGVRPRPPGGGGLAIIDEDCAPRPRCEYGAYKASVEAHLWAAHLGDGRDVCALRPCAVYGIDPRLERSHGYRIVEELRASGHYARSGGQNFVHLEDVVRAVVAVVGDPRPAGRAYNLVDCHARHTDWARIAGELLGLDASIGEDTEAGPAHTFSKDAAATLGVPLDRGLAGIRAHLAELIGVMDRDSGR